MPEYDIQRIINWGLGFILSIVIFCIFRKEIPRDYKIYRSLIAIGMALVLMAITSNSLMMGNWTLGFIMDFILIKKVGIVAFRKIACGGYVLILWGLTLSLFVKIKKQNETKT